VTFFAMIWQTIERAGRIQSDDADAAAGANLRKQQLWSR
jgi:hypothetical protein